MRTRRGHPKNATRHSRIRMKIRRTCGPITRVPVSREVSPTPNCSENKGDSCNYALEPVHRVVAASPLCEAQDDAFVVAQTEVALFLTPEGAGREANAVGVGVKRSPGLLQEDDLFRPLPFPHLANPPLAFLNRTPRHWGERARRVLDIPKLSYRLQSHRHASA